MNPAIHLKKDHPDLPDKYGVKITRISGKVDEYEVALHRYIDKIPFFDDNGRIVRFEVNPVPMIELVLFEDKLLQIPTANIEIEFDKRYLKILDIGKKLKEQQKANNNIKQ